MYGLSLGCTYLNVRLLARSQCAYERSCDRPVWSTFPLVFIGPRENDEPISKSHVAAHVSRALPPHPEQWLKNFLPTCFLPNITKVQSQCNTSDTKFSPNAQLLQQPTLHHLSLLGYQRSTLHPAYLYQKNERALPRNLHQFLFSPVIMHVIALSVAWCLL